MRNPIAGELISTLRDGWGHTAFGIVLPARFKSQTDHWCVYWFDLGHCSTDFCAQDVKWKIWSRHIVETDV